MAKFFPEEKKENWKKINDSKIININVWSLTITISSLSLTFSNPKFLQSWYFVFLRVTNSLTYYGLNLISTTLYGDRYLNFFFLGAIEYLSALAEFLLLNRYIAFEFEFSTIVSGLDNHLCCVLLFLLRYNWGKMLDKSMSYCPLLILSPQNWSSKNSFLTTRVRGSIPSSGYYIVHVQR
jgi:hypothetical protein